MSGPNAHRNKKTVLSLAKREVVRVVVAIVNALQKRLGTDPVCNVLRLFLLRCVGNKFGTGVRIFSGCDFLGGRLSVGAKVFINRNCYFDMSGRITLEDGVSVGHGVTFITTVHEIGPREKRAGVASGRDIIVRRGTWIGANATIQPGVDIGSGAIVMAGAVVTKDVPRDTVVGGVPAVVIRDLPKD